MKLSFGGFCRVLSTGLLLHLVWWAFTGMPLWGPHPSAEQIGAIIVVHLLGCFAAIAWVD